MLREIISITGKPGLFKIISHGNRRIIVEDVATGKRFPALERDQIISLGDIAMYTQGDDKPLGEILDLVYEKNDGKAIDIKDLSEGSKLREVFREILPDFDEDRVHNSDIKKLFSWYNILVGSGMKKFSQQPENAEKKDDTANSQSENPGEKDAEDKA